MHPVDKQVIQLLENSLASKQKQEKQLLEQDDDKLFCLSLFTEIKKFPENRRLKTKIELLNVLQKAQNVNTEECNHAMYQQNQWNPNTLHSATNYHGVPNASFTAPPPTLSTHAWFTASSPLEWQDGTQSSSPNLHLFE